MPLTLSVGKGGHPYIVKRDKLSLDEQKQYDAGWENNAYNSYASDRISLHRKIDDTRYET